MNIAHLLRRSAQLYPIQPAVLQGDQLADRDHPRWAERMVSVGVAQSLVEVRMVDAAGQPVPT